MPDVYTIAEAATRLDELVRRAAAGEEILLNAPDGTRVRLAEDVAAASRLPPSEPGKRVFGQLAGRFVVPDDFDETPEWLVEAFYHSDTDEELLSAPLQKRAAADR